MSFLACIAEVEGCGVLFQPVCHDVDRCGGVRETKSCEILDMTAFEEVVSACEKNGECLLIFVASVEVLREVTHMGAEIAGIKA